MLCVRLATYNARGARLACRRGQLRFRHRVAAGPAVNTVGRSARWIGLPAQLGRRPGSDLQILQPGAPRPSPHAPDRPL